MDAEVVGVAGDWHYDVGHALKVIEQFHSLGIQHIFQLGDFGIWGGLLEHSKDKFRWRIQQKLEAYDMYLFVTLGNHEKYTLYEKFLELETGPLEGFKYEARAPRILYFQRGQSFQIGGRNFLSLGGAASIDYKFRVEGHSIWKQERITHEDVRKTIAEAKTLGSVDVFLAHDVFSSAPIFGTHRQSPKWDSEERAYAQTSRDALEIAAKAILPTLWLHGHYHLPIATEVELQGTTAKKDRKGKLLRERKLIKTYCLAMNGKPESTGVLWLDKLQFEYLPNLK